jgi:hypothetical protein
MNLDWNLIVNYGCAVALGLILAGLVKYVAGRIAAS